MKLRVLGLIALVSLSACSDDSPSPGNSDPGKSGPSQAPEGSKQGDSQGSQEEPEEKLDCSALKSTGLNVGDVAPNLELVDGNGKSRMLHEFCNDTVILIASEH